jgi:putative hydrolase of the HAD superfamily
MNSHIDAIVFDIGGVLVELGGVGQMIEWCGGTLDEQELWRRWLGSPSVRRFESGQSNATEFARTVLEEFALQVECEVFLQAFATWPKALYPGATRLLRLLAPRYYLASLSNTNALHWQYVCDGLGLADCFHAHFPSHLTGRLKPDREAFAHVVERLDIRPERMVFLDDNLLNVEMARSVGMHAYRVRGVEETIATLTALQLYHAEASAV